MNNGTHQLINLCTYIINLNILQDKYIPKIYRKTGL